MKYDIITFDCYGTLVDWDGGIAGAFERFATARDLPFDRERVLEIYHQEEPKVQAAEFRPYREVLVETADRVATRVGWDLTWGAGTFLPDDFDKWTPFDDTNPSLARLIHTGHRLGILSNIDDDLLGVTLRHFAVEFDLIVTAQQVESYKPADGHFLEARRRIGDARWLHAAQSYFHDVVPAVRHGIDVVWINRLNEEPTGDEQPLESFENLEEFAAWME